MIQNNLVSAKKSSTLRHCHLMASLLNPSSGNCFKPCSSGWRLFQPFPSPLC